MSNQRPGRHRTTQRRNARWNAALGGIGMYCTLAACATPHLPRYERVSEAWIGLVLVLVAVLPPSGRSLFRDVCRGAGWLCTVMAGVVGSASYDEACTLVVTGACMFGLWWALGRSNAPAEKGRAHA